VSVRTGAVFWLFSSLGGVRLPTQFRVLLVLALSMALAGAVHPALRMEAISLAALVAAVAREALIGGAMGLMLSALFAAMHFGGQLLDTQIGFGLANLIDPITRAQAPLLGVVLNLAALMVFFGLDGPHWMIRGLAASLESLPPGDSFGALPGAAALASAVSVPVGYVFAYGLAAVAPAVMGVLLVDIGFAVLSRTVPQMNVLIVSIPAKILVGLGLFALCLPFMAPLVEHLLRLTFGLWSALR